MTIQVYERLGYNSIVDATSVEAEEFCTQIRNVTSASHLLDSEFECNVVLYPNDKKITGSLYLRVINHPSPLLITLRIETPVHKNRSLEVNLFIAQNRPPNILSFIRTAEDESHEGAFSILRDGLHNRFLQDDFTTPMSVLLLEDLQHIAWAIDQLFESFKVTSPKS